MSHDNEEWFKEMLILENMHFLCDAIDLKQSVGGSLKVLGKSLTTVLDEVHSIFNLSSFPLPLVPKSKLFLPQGKSFASLPSRTTSKTPLSFSVSPLFWGYLGSQVAINEMVSNLDYHPCPSRLASRIHPVIFLSTP